MSNKYLYELYGQTNRVAVSFEDVPPVFKQRIRNYRFFCSNATSLDVSGTPISTLGLHEVIMTALHLTLITALDCPNIRNGKLFVRIAIKKNIRQLKEIKNRKIRIELSMPEPGIIYGGYFYELWKMRRVGIFETCTTVLREMSSNMCAAGRTTRSRSSTIRGCLESCLQMGESFHRIFKIENL